MQVKILPPRPYFEIGRSVLAEGLDPCSNRQNARRAHTPEVQSGLVGGGWHRCGV